MIPLTDLSGPPALAPQAVWICQSAGALPIERALARDPIHAAIARQLASKADGPGSLVSGPIARFTVTLPPGGALAVALEAGAVMPEKSTSGKPALWTLPGLPDTLQIQENTLIWSFPQSVLAHQWPDKKLVARIPENASCVAWNAQTHELSIDDLRQHTTLELLTGEFANAPTWPKLKLSAFPEYLLAAIEFPDALATTAMAHWKTEVPSQQYLPAWSILTKMPGPLQGWILSATSKDHQRASKDTLAVLETELKTQISKKGSALYLGDLQGKVEVPLPAQCSVYGIDGLQTGCLEPLDQKSALTTVSVPLSTEERPLPGPATSQPLTTLLDHARLSNSLDSLGPTIEKDPLYGGFLPDNSTGGLWIERTENRIRLLGSVDSDKDGVEAVYAWDSEVMGVIRITAENIW